jgi:peroxiredoxin
VAELMDDGAARHLKPGMGLPDIALPSTHGGATSLAALSGTLVVYVYPWTGRPGSPNPPNWDDIPGAHGSTPQAEGFRDLYEAYRALGVGIYGVSGQDTAYQREFSDRLGLPFVLLSDETETLQRALSLPVFITGGKSYLKRLTLITRNGKIARVIYPVADPAAHAEEVLGMLRSGTD